jgi:alpha-beta hydrolase superfamily lysophospholipase
MIPHCIEGFVFNGMACMAIDWRGTGSKCMGNGVDEMEK